MTAMTGPLRMVRDRLRNDTEVLLQQSPPSARSFAVSFVGPAGWGFENGGPEGVAAVTSRLLVTRPGGRTREELARTLDRLGGSLTSSTDPESAEVALWGPVDAWRPLLRIFADAVLHPTFTEEELARVLRQVRERQLRQKVQPDLRADRDLLARMFPKGHPYRATGLGTPRSVGHITPDLVERFHRRHYPGRSGVLVVTASAPPRDLLRALSAVFEPSSTRAEPASPSLSSGRPDSRPYHVSIPGQSQVAVRLGAPSLPRSDPKYPALYLLNEVLGGRPLLSRLFQRVRERHGLAYHASSELEAMRWGGYWDAVAGTDPATRDRVVRMMKTEVGRLSTETIPHGELSRIRESALGALPLELETTASAHELAVEVAYHRLPVDFYLKWPATVRGLSPRSLRAVAETDFRVDDAAIVTAGPPPR